MIIHLIERNKNVSYFIERPWGNLLVYPLLDVKQTDLDHFISKGGVYRQMVLENFSPNASTKTLFDRLGAAVVAPFEMEFNSYSLMEKDGVEFCDPHVTYLEQGEMRALKIGVKDKIFLFTDSHFTLKAEKIFCLNSSLSHLADEFVAHWKAEKVARVMTPTYSGKNYIDLF